MLMESATIQVLHVYLLALTATERWGAANKGFGDFSAVESWLTGFAMAALIISLILVFHLSANNKRSLYSFRRKIDALRAQIKELEQRIDELEQHKTSSGVRVGFAGRI